MAKGIVVCEYCDHTEFYDGVCPNDVQADTGYDLHDDGTWTCPDCTKELWPDEEKGWIVTEFKAVNEEFFETLEGAEMHAEGLHRLHGRLTKIKEGERGDI